jgi:hypothetical protein
VYRVQVSTLPSGKNKCETTHDNEIVLKENLAKFNEKRKSAVEITHS